MAQNNISLKKEKANVLPHYNILDINTELSQWIDEFYENEKVKPEIYILVCTNALRNHASNNIWNPATAQGPLDKNQK